MTKTQRKEQINAKKIELAKIRDRLPFWGSYAKDIVNYLKERGVVVTENQVYIAVKTGLGSKSDHILIAMKTLAERYEQSLSELV
ncbi:hypothetical protein [Pedobacter sp.]|uniref:hypothetical protein n=1 Tax=Pedobacter sp. TaxID=1411316 RepID=UPI003C5D53C9